MAKVSLYMTKLNNREFSRLVSSLLRDWQASKVTLDDPVFTKLKTRLTQQSELLHQGLSEVKDSQAAKDLDKADKLRDQNLQFLADSIKLGRYAQTTEEQAAYEALKPFFKDTAKIKRSNYEEESESINGILNQLKKTELQPHVRALNLTKAVASLTKSQTDFEALLLKRHTGKTTQTVYDNKKARKDLQETYILLADYLHVMSKEATPVAYKKLYQIFATNSDFFKPLTSSRKAKDKTALPKEEPAQPAEQDNA